MYTGEKGNALFLILIGVALFAALSYAVTTSGRGGGTVDKEELQLRAAQVLQEVSLVQQAVQRMQLIGGIPISQLEFNADVNPHCTSDECRVYKKNGGGLTYRDPKDEWLDPALKNLYEDYRIWEFYAMAIKDVGTTCTANTCSDLVMMLEAIDPDLCAAINKRVGIAGIPTGEDFTIGGGGARYDGTFYGSSIIGDDAPALAGQRTACYLESDSTPSYIFYSVIIER